MDTNISYDFLAPPRIAFGWGRRREVGVLGRTLGWRALMVCGLPPEIADGVMDELAALLRAEGVESTRLATVLREPEVGDVDQAAAQLRAEGVREGDFLLAIGGGAAIDLAKAVAAMATSRESATVKDFVVQMTLSLITTVVFGLPTLGKRARVTLTVVLSTTVSLTGRQ